MHQSSSSKTTLAYATLSFYSSFRNFTSVDHCQSTYDCRREVYHQFLACEHFFWTKLSHLVPYKAGPRCNRLNQWWTAGTKQTYAATTKTGGNPHRDSLDHLLHVHGQERKSCTIYVLQGNQPALWIARKPEMWEILFPCCVSVGSTETWTKLSKKLVNKW